MTRTNGAKGTRAIVRGLVTFLVVWIFSGCTGRYFPKHSFTTNQVHMRRLQDLGEHPLAESSEPEVFRVFAADPAHGYLVKVALIDGKGVLLVARLDERRVENAGQSFDWSVLRQLAERADYWRLSINADGEMPSFDGSMCYVEGLEEGRYHIVRRKSQIITPEFAALCHHVLSLAGFPPVFQKYRGPAPAQSPQ